MLPRFLDSRLTDGDEVVDLTRRPPLTPGRFPVFISIRGRVVPRGHCVAVSIISIEQSSDFVGNGTCDLPACSIAPKPTTLLRAPFRFGIH
jgi:hypothetical protein